MYNILSVGQQNYITKTSEVAKTKQPQTQNSVATNPINTPSFCAHPTDVKLRTELVNKEEIEKFTEVSKGLNKVDRKLLEFLLKTGTLLKDDSNDKSTVLDNMYKIATTPRAEGLKNDVILSDVINTLANPFIITQQFGNIPDTFRAKALEASAGTQTDNLIERYKQKGKEEIDVPTSGVCVAASIEFNLANRMPAEFARLAENLSSPALSAKKIIQMKNLTDNTLDSVWLLNSFEIPYTMDGYDNATLTLAPDKNAIIRAQIQTVDRDPLERSPLDVLMQSMLMQVGSQQSYNTLTDKRAGKFNNQEKGLIEFEKTFTESIVENKNKMSVTYQKLDDDGKLIGYETDFATMKNQIGKALNMGENVIIGYTQVDDTNKVINGHEITIIGMTTDKKTKETLFICNDTDDDKSEPIVYPESYLLPKIHHAGLPESVVAADTTQKPNWVEGIDNYKLMKKV